MPKSDIIQKHIVRFLIAQSNKSVVLRRKKLDLFRRLHFLEIMMSGINYAAVL